MGFLRYGAWLLEEEIDSFWIRENFFSWYLPKNEIRPQNPAVHQPWGSSGMESCPSIQLLMAWQSTVQ